MAETKKPAAKKPTTKKKTTKKLTNTTKKPAASVKKPVSSVKKTNTAKTTTSTLKKTTKSRKAPPKKTTPVVKEDVKKETVVKVIPKKKAPQRKKPKTTTPKTKKQIKAEVVTKEAIEKVFEGKETVEKKKLGKTFYLIFSVVFFAIAFFYINNVVYDNGDYIQSALFAFASLFVIFVLLNFGVHRILINFFRLPFKFLFEEAKAEIHKDIIVDPNEKGMKGRFSKYKAIFTIIIYSLILILLIGSQIWNGVLDGDKVLIIITQSLSTGLVFLVIVCSWQYLFNIIPDILENSIDAKNGYILTLSAIVMIIYVVFIIFDISYLAEMMIFILIIGFIALLGVNLNMIVGEFNIFKNLKNRSSQNKSVTRAVFLIFFSFHLYIILYASVVAYSIYNWNPDTYNFTNFQYEDVVIENVDYLGNEVMEVYDSNGALITTVYDESGNEVTEFIDEDGKYILVYYNSIGDPLRYYYSPTDINEISEVEKDGEFYYLGANQFHELHFTYLGGTLVGIKSEAIPHTYGDMLYYAVITISSIGYGDISPNSNYALPQFWGGFLSIYGITFYALSIGYVSNIAGIGVSEKREED